MTKTIKLNKTKRNIKNKSKKNKSKSRKQYNKILKGGSNNTINSSIRTSEHINFKRFIIEYASNWEDFVESYKSMLVKENIIQNDNYKYILTIMYDEKGNHKSYRLKTKNINDALKGETNLGQIKQIQSSLIKNPLKDINIMIDIRT